MMLLKENYDVELILLLFFWLFHGVVGILYGVECGF
jgi:hypothetical protein